MSREPGLWMWADALAMLDRAERLHRSFFEPAGARDGRPAWQPPADIFENEHEIGIVLALPGVAPDQIRLAVEGNALVISGERRLPPAFRAARVHRLEIPQGRFERRLALPSGRFELGHKEYSDGCLLITLTKVK